MGELLFVEACEELEVVDRLPTLREVGGVADRESATARALLEPLALVPKYREAEPGEAHAATRSAERAR
jgi:hypothetical protein